MTDNPIFGLLLCIHKTIKEIDLICLFQISDIVIGKEENVTAREALLRWAKRTTEKYPGVHVNDLTLSFRDGLAFSAIVHRNRPELIDWKNVRNQKPRERLDIVFNTLEKECNVGKLLEPEGEFFNFS